MVHPKTKVKVLKGLISELHQSEPKEEKLGMFESEAKEDPRVDIEQLEEGMETSPDMVAMKGVRGDEAFSHQQPIPISYPEDSSNEEAMKKNISGGTNHVRSELHRGSKLGGVSHGKGQLVNSKYQGPHGGKEALQDSMAKRKPIRKVTE